MKLFFLIALLCLIKTLLPDFLRNYVSNEIDEPNPKLMETNLP